MSGFIFKKVYVTDPDNMKANYIPYHIISYGIIDQFFKDKEGYQHSRG